MYNLLVVDDDVDILNINQIYFSNIGLMYIHQRLLKMLWI